MLLDVPTEDKVISFDELRERLRKSGLEGRFDEVACTGWLRRLSSSARERVLVAFSERSDDVSPFMFSALVAGGPDEHERVLSRSAWDVSQTIGQPDIITYGGRASDAEWSYDDGHWEQSRVSDLFFRPIVLSRYFDGPETPRFELVQEFELFMRATWHGDELLWFDDAGDPHTAARRFDNAVSRGIEVAEHELRDYLAVTRLALVRFSEFFRRVVIDVKAVLGEDERVRVRETTATSLRELLVTTDDVFGVEDHLWVSVHAKDVVLGYSRPTPRQFNEHDEGYEEFAIGRDTQGREVQRPCGPDLRDFLIPVMFRRDVLARYQQEPSKFEIRHQQVTCHGLWSLTFDTLSDGRISVFLGDLGHIPRKEQRHWRGFNVAEQGRISQTRHETAILGQWPSTPTQDPPYEFKEGLENASAAGARLLGQELFRPLDEADAHLRDGLHVPATNVAREFDVQIQAMAKMVGDSINVQAIKKRAGLRIDGQAIKGSLDLLEAWLKQLNIPEDGLSRVMAPLRLLQQLRSQGAAHRRGSGYLLLIRAAGLEDLTNIERVQRVMVAATHAFIELTSLLAAIPDDYLAT